MLFYRRTMDRLWGITVILGFELFAVWWYGSNLIRQFRPGIDALILYASIYTLTLGWFAFVARWMAYVRAFPDYLLIATPFFRFRTSYRRVLEIRPTEFHRLFDPDNFSWADEQYLRSFVGQTSIVINLREFPIRPGLLRLFFPAQFFSPQSTGFVLVVSDWMGLSVEIDSRMGEWRQKQIERSRMAKRTPGFQRGRG